jgi:hypothetical protein
MAVTGMMVAMVVVRMVRVGRHGGRELSFGLIGQMLYYNIYRIV